MLYQINDGTVSLGGNVILDHIDFEIRGTEKIAVTGANGAGKTTLLQVLSGELELDGDDKRMGPGITMSRRLTVGMLKQGVFTGDDRTVEEELLAACPCKDTFERERFEYEQEYDRLFTGFGLKREDKKRLLSSFSGGEKTKIALIRLLLEKPDILLLDEPTNYLDEQHIEWLKRYLLEYENAFILISHDIPFLNSVVNIIYHMENQSLDRYVGDYDKFVEVHAVKKAQLEAAYKRQQQEIAELEDFVARNKARVSTRNMAMSRQKKLDKMDVIELAREKPKPEFHFLEARTAGKTIIETTDLIIGYDEPLSRPLNVRMERGEKIVLVGANGIGKTTLLKSILGLVPPLDGKVMLGDYLSIGYFEQEMAPGNKTTCIEEIWKEFPSYTQYQVRSALAKCGLTTKHIESQVRVLSGGEQAKVRLCKLINRETNVLLLDEPTNHLDVEAKEELKRALKEYKGSILLICHEPEFYEGVATKVWDCREWALKLS